MHWQLLRAALHLCTDVPAFCCAQHTMCVHSGFVLAVTTQAPVGVPIPMPTAWPVPTLVQTPTPVPIEVPVPVLVGALRAGVARFGQTAFYCLGRGLQG